VTLGCPLMIKSLGNFVNQPDYGRRLCWPFFAVLNNRFLFSAGGFRFARYTLTTHPESSGNALFKHAQLARLSVVPSVIMSQNVSGPVFAVALPAR